MRAFRRETRHVFIGARVAIFASVLATGCGLVIDGIRTDSSASAPEDDGARVSGGTGVTGSSASSASSSSGAPTSSSSSSSGTSGTSSTSGGASSSSGAVDAGAPMCVIPNGRTCGRDSDCAGSPGSCQGGCAAGRTNALEGTCANSCRSYFSSCDPTRNDCCIGMRCTGICVSCARKNGYTDTLHPTCCSGSADVNGYCAN